MPQPIEQQLEEMNAGIGRISNEIKPLAENALREAKQAGTVSAETRAKVDELLTQFGAMQGAQQALQQQVLAGGRDDDAGDARTAGQMIAAKLEEQGVNSNSRGAYRVSIPQAAITSVTGSGGALVAPERRAGIVAPPQRRMTVRSLVAPGRTESSSYEYVKETGFTNNAAPVAEGMQKPYSDLTFELATAHVRTIPHLFKASRQILDDASALASYIDARARYGLDSAEETQLLYGNGTGANLHGIVPQAQTFEPAFTVAAAQGIDRIRLAILQVMLAEYPADGIVLNPIDWALIELLKDSENRYIIGKAQEGTTPTLWKLPVVETQSMQSNDFLVGAFSLASQILDRSDTEVLVSTENDKDFETNMVTIRAERRLAFAVYRPEAFVTGEVNPGVGG